MGVNRGRALLGALAVVSGLGLAACRPVTGPSTTPARESAAVLPAHAPVAASGDVAVASRPAASKAAGRAIVLIDDRESLSRLAGELDLGRMLFDVPGGSTKQLRRSSRYRGFVWGVVQSEEGEREGEFPAWWLGHPSTFFTLVGVANRLDRRDLLPGTCGETRLVHRLAHRREDGDLRYLPMTVNVVLAQPDDGQGCRTVAASWIVPEGEDAVVRLTATGGPLHADRLGLDRLRVVETNTRRDDFDYWDEPEPGRGRNELRAFVLDEHGRELESAHLEFQPWSKLYVGYGQGAKWLRTPGVLEAIEHGTASLPDRIQWDWAPVHLLGRDDEEMFEFDVVSARRDALEGVTLPSEGVTSTREGLTQRLIGMSCQGCHSARSVAGFHLPGEGDGLRGGASAHLSSELPWRVAYVEAVAEGREPATQRKLPEDGPPGFGRSCSREGSPIPTLQCDPGFECAEAPGFRFGVCLPEGYEGPAPCERGEPMCRPPSPWFPAGFVAQACEDGQACAAIPTPRDARKCRWAVDPWACAFERATPVAVDRCEDQAGCRTGYACVEDEGGGTCLPAAVVPELRVIGHRTRLR